MQCPQATRASLLVPDCTAATMLTSKPHHPLVQLFWVRLRIAHRARPSLRLQVVWAHPRGNLPASSTFGARHGTMPGPPLRASSRHRQTSRPSLSSTPRPGYSRCRAPQALQRPGARAVADALGVLAPRAAPHVGYRQHPTGPCSFEVLSRALASAEQHLVPAPQSH